MKKKKLTLKRLIFMALCCDIGFVSKKLISPVTNLITDSLHIPGGIGSSFSIMFIIIGAVICDVPGCAILMCAVQGMTAVIIGAGGSMGLLMVVGYIVPGIVIEICLLIFRKLKIVSSNTIAVTNALAGASATVFANAVTFGLKGIALVLYVAVGFTSGVIFGYLGALLLKRLRPILRTDCAAGKDS